MSTTRRPAAALLLALTLLTAACSETGSLEISNESPHRVTVRLGDETVEVSSGGGAVLHRYGCTPGDVVVTSASGQPDALDGPVCSDQQITIDRSGAVTVSPGR